VLVATLSIALVTGCGDSDDDGGGAAAAPSGSSGGETPVADGGSGPATTRTGSDRAQIAATLRYMRAAFNDADGKAYCAKLTDVGERQVVRVISGYTRPGANLKTCQQLISSFSRATLRSTGRRSRQLPVNVISVRIDGDRAAAKVTGGQAGQSVLVTRLARQDGEWKVDDLGFRNGA
jgi:hypothetical protein